MNNKDKVRQMFNDISPRYDFLNHFLSLGIDRYWRRQLVSFLRVRYPREILDIACGTGDVAIALCSLRPSRIVGMDVAGEMLRIAVEKTNRRGLQDVITYREGDAEQLPFSDDTFDAVTVAFGVRNYGNLEKGLSEMRRVLKPGGVMVVLEFSHPLVFPVKQLYRFYSRFLIPFFGRLISRHREAYRYLPDTVAQFPSGASFTAILEKTGLVKTGHIPLTLGIATLYYGEK